MKNILMRLGLLGFISSMNGFALDGTYLVPVLADLAPHASFPVKNVRFEILGDDLQIDYHLPIELVGEGKPCIELRGKKVAGDEWVQVSGRRVTGKCLVAGDEIPSCMLTYPNLEIDFDSREKFILENYKGPALDAVLKVANQFASPEAQFLNGGGSPAGILLVHP